MTSDKEEQYVHTTMDTEKKKKPEDTGGKNVPGKGKSVNYRSDGGIAELAGCYFSFGNPGQQSNYLKTRKAIADHFGMTSDFGKEIYMAIKEGKEPEFMEPEEPPAKATQGQLRKYEILFKRYLVLEIQQYLA
jgi:hypothetical protein